MRHWSANPLVSSDTDVICPNNGQIKVFELNMLYNEHPPHPALSQVIKSYSLLKGRLAEPGGVSMQFPSCGGSELVLNLGDSAAAGIDIESLVPSYACSVIGSLSRHLHVKLTGDSNLVSVHFLPGGLSNILKLPAFELTDQCTDLESIVGVISRNLVEKVGNSKKFSDIVEILDKFFLGRCHMDLVAGDCIHQALGIMTVRGGKIRITDVVALTGLSRRQFERRFLSRVGITPKRFCRIKRFYSVLYYHSRFPNCEWTEIALACGYSDQAHLIRECNFFSGKSPAVYLNSINKLERVLLGI